MVVGGRARDVGCHTLEPQSKALTIVTNRQWGRSQGPHWQVSVTMVGRTTRAREPPTLTALAFTPRLLRHQKNSLGRRVGHLSGEVFSYISMICGGVP